jgi:hypothetical protein
MTIIDQRTVTSYPNLTVKQAAVMVGVSKMTIFRWKKTTKKQEYNHFLIIFNECNVTLPTFN